VQRTEETIKGSDGNRLFTQYNEVEDPKGAAVILHGYCEHLLRYGHVVERLTAEGFNCYLLDHRGHGKSDGQRAAVINFEEYLNDLDIFMKKVRSRYSEGPIVMIGHSMGGLIAANYMLSRKPEMAGVVLSSPYLGLKLALPAWKEMLGSTVSRFLPRVSLKSELDPYLLTHDEAIVQEYISDPAVPKVANVRWFTEAAERQDYCMTHASEWNWPSVFMHGGDDRIADPQATRKLHAAVGKEDVELKIWEGMYHEIFNEVDRKKVLDVLAKWMIAQVVSEED